MPKIDTSAIEGYSDMTADEKLAALEAFEYNDGSDELSRYKSATTKANSEAAEYKRQLKEAQAKLAEADSKATEGQTAAERQLAEMRAQLESMQRDKTVADYTARLVSSGYVADLAAESAAALADGDAETFFKGLSSFIESHDKALTAQLAQRSITPDKGNKPEQSGMTMQKLRSMSPAQRAAFAASHPDEYAKLYEKR